MAAVLSFFGFSDRQFLGTLQECTPRASTRAALTLWIFDATRIGGAPKPRKQRKPPRKPCAALWQAEKER